MWRWSLQNGLRINGIDEGILVWNFVQTIGKNIINECNNSIVLEEGGKDDKTLTTSGGKTMLWHQILGHIGEKGL